MLVKHLSYEFVERALRKEGLVIAIGPFVFSIKSTLKDIVDNIYLLYADFPCLTHDVLIDFYVSVAKPNSLRRWLKPQIHFYDDQLNPFEPLPVSQAFPLLEWGMNWSIAQHSHQYLMIHAAVLEKNGLSVVLPAESGSGKSTLCALLAMSGWRLLSDEMALINTNDLTLTPLCRPISLKNESINIIKSAADNTVFSQAVDDTNKGTIAHLKPPTASVEKMNVIAKLNRIIFPKFDKDTSLDVHPFDQADAFMALINNSFNYPQLGQRGFETVEGIVKSVDSYQLRYGDSDAVVAFFDKLAAEQ